jgi:guanylate kinase
LATARREVRAVAEYEYVIVNDELETCVDRLRAIVLAERARSRVMAPAIAQIAASFAGVGKDSE